MDEFKFFKNFKERGEWVELRFMAAALRLGFKVLKPWGDSSPFDVAVCFGNRIVRVQVKSTSVRTGTGYFCQFKPNYLNEPYTLDQLDLFAAYVIPQHLVPDPRPRPPRRRSQQTRPDALPHGAPEENRYRYECYREAWPLLRPRNKSPKPRSGKN